MVTFRTAASLLSAAVLCLTEVNGYGGGWHMDTLATLVNERLDPIVSPNGVASHMHKVLGGSNFGASYSFDQSRAGKCTTALITVDKSNYWMPQLYWINDDTSGTDGAHTFTVIPASSRFYYILEQPASSNGAPNTAFPPGLRMLVGNPNNKAALPDYTYVFNCMNGYTTVTTAKGPSFNFDIACDTMQTIVQFPSCWDGMNLYKSDGSHVVYMSGGTTGQCPISCVTLRIEGIT